MSRVFTNGPGDRGSNLWSSHTKDSKMVLDVALLNIYYKVRINGKVEESREWNSTLHYTSV